MTYQRRMFLAILQTLVMLALCTGFLTFWTASRRSDPPAPSHREFPVTHDRKFSTGPSGVNNKEFTPKTPPLAPPPSTGGIGVLPHTIPPR